MAKWLFHQHLDNKHGHHIEASKYGCPFTCVGGPRQQNHQAMNALILNNPQARQTQNEKKAIDQAKKKVKAKWDRLQLEAQGFEEVHQHLLVKFAFDKLLNVINILKWGVGFVLIMPFHELKG
jgi:iron only hydrogenase large subunit-like protein